MHGDTKRTLFFSYTLAFKGFNVLSTHFFLLFCVTFALLLIYCQLLFHGVLGSCHGRKNGSHDVVLIKDGDGVVRLCRRVASSIASKFHIVNCFSSRPNDHFPRGIGCLKGPNGVISHLGRKKIRRICYYLPSTHDRRVLPVVSCYRGRLVHFFDIPGIHDCLGQHVCFRLLNGIPMLYVHRRPLDFTRGQFEGHIFSVTFSLLFLYALFPVVCIVIKLAVGVASPNPVFFGRGHDKRSKQRF